MKMIIMHMYKHMLCMHYNIITTRYMTIFLWTEIIIILIFCRCLIEFKKPGSSVPSWLHYKTHIKYNRLHQKVYIWIAISHAMVVLRSHDLICYVLGKLLLVIKWLHNHRNTTLQKTVNFTSMHIPLISRRLQSDDPSSLDDKWNSVGELRLLNIQKLSLLHTLIKIGNRLTWYCG